MRVSSCTKDMADLRTASLFAVVPGLVNGSSLVEPDLGTCPLGSSTETIVQMCILTSSWEILLTWSGVRRDGREVSAGRIAVGS